MTKKLNQRGKTTFNDVEQELKTLANALEPMCQLSSFTISSTRPVNEALWQEAIEALYQHEQSKSYLHYQYVWITLNKTTKLFWCTPSDVHEIDIKDVSIAEKISCHESFNLDVKEEREAIKWSARIAIDENDARKHLPEYFLLNQYRTAYAYHENKAKGHYDVPLAYVKGIQQHHQAIEKKLLSRAERRFTEVMNQLVQLNKDENNASLRININKLIQQINDIKNRQSKKLAELVMIMEATCLLIDANKTTDVNSPHIKQYMQLANRVQGSPNDDMQMLGVTMMIVGGFMVFYASILITMALLSPPSSFSLFYLGVGFGAPGSVILPWGVGLFCTHQRQGISKVMDSVKNDVVDELKPCI